MDKLVSIPNFMQVSERVATAGQPDLEQLEALADAGYRVVINLAPTDGEHALANEAQWSGQLGMQYIHIPVDFAAPSERDFVRFVNAMNLHLTEKCFVHCDSNERVSVFMALYQMLTGELDGEAAWMQIKCTWQPDATWQAFIREISDKFKLVLRAMQ